MKKTLTFLLIALCVKLGFAQGENEIKNFRFGVKVSPSLNWYKPESKKIEKNGISPKLSGGVTLEYRLGKNVSLVSGLEFNGDGGKLNYTKDTALYYISDEEIISRVDTAGKKYSLLKLNERKYNAIYFMVPIQLKMKTKEIGMLTYYAQVGSNLYIRKSAKANDQASIFTTTGMQAVEQSDLDVKKEFMPFRFSANFSLGAEYNLAGSTSAFFSLGYDYGLTRTLKQDSEYLFRTASNGYAPVDQKALSSSIQLNLGILF